MTTPKLKPDVLKKPLTPKKSLQNLSKQYRKNNRSIYYCKKKLKSELEAVF